ncbi:MAG: WbqC family protein [bacterium]
MKRIAILQPGYLPWLGFFEQMYRSDVFVYLDDVQYTKNDWRNRNRIKTQTGVQWLTVPVSFRFGQEIREAKIDNSNLWSKKHLQSLKTWYGKSSFFKKYIEELDGLFRQRWDYLIDLDIQLVKWLMDKLGLTTKTVLSSEIPVQTEDRQLRLIEICKTLESHYLYEGKSGQSYIDIHLFEAQGVTVEFQNYPHPYYHQLWLKEQGFISHLSILDLLFNHGPDSLLILTGQKIMPPPEGMRIRHADEL